MSLCFAENPNPVTTTRGKCPTCDSPAPHLHPAVQFEGEVSLCADSFHDRVDRVRALPPAEALANPGADPAPPMVPFDAKEWTCPTCGGDALWCKCSAALRPVPDQCTGPFSDAFDCPVHDPRKREPERTK